MNKLIALIRVSLKVNFVVSPIRHRLFHERRDRWMILLVLVSIAGLVPMFTAYLGLIKTVHGILAPLGQQHALLTLAILAGQLFVVVFGVYYVISAFYFSRDLELLIPLPLKPFHVVFAKFLTILINAYLTIMPLVLPILIYCGILDRVRPTYWPLMGFVYLLLPVIPLAIVSLAVIGLMRVVNLSRKKDALVVAGALMLVAASLALQLVIGRPSAGPGEDQVVRFFTSRDGIVHWIRSRFPPSIWATRILGVHMQPENWTALFLYAGISLLLFLGMLLGGERLFYRGLIGMKEISGRKKIAARKKPLRGLSSGMHPVKAIFLREWRIMNRTPIFLLNVLSVILIPLVFTFAFRRGGKNFMPFVLQIMASTNQTYKILAAVGFMLLCSCLNGTASSAFSREGSQFWVSKVIPVSYRVQVTAKFLHSALIALLGIAISSPLILWVLRLSAAEIVFAVALAFPAAATLIIVSLIIDLARPLLDWINPQRAIKQNINVLMALLADFGILGGSGFVSVYLLRSGLSGYIVIPLLLAVFTAASITGFRCLLRSAEKRYPAIER